MATFRPLKNLGDILKLLNGNPEQLFRHPRFKSAAEATVVGNAASTAAVDNKISTNNASIKPYKRYAASLTQTSTSAPTATSVTTELGVTPTLARTSAGLYTVTATGKFTAAKTRVFASGAEGILNKVSIVHTSANVITITTSVLSVSGGVLISTPTDGLLTDYSIEVQVDN